MERAVGRSAAHLVHQGGQVLARATQWLAQGDRAVYIVDLTAQVAPALLPGFPAKLDQLHQADLVIDNPALPGLSGWQALVPSP
jgi:hypothetical protein